MQALEDGPRAADQFATVMASLIVMVSALSNVQELLAQVMLALARGLEKARAGSDGVASSNTIRVVCCMYLCKGIGAPHMRIAVMIFSITCYHYTCRILAAVLVLCALIYDSTLRATLLPMPCITSAGSKVIYSLLEHLKQKFSDGDVHLILLVLQTVGYQLRGDDGVGMKAFIESVHGKSATLRTNNALSQRARLMLELIVDIKNNRKRKNLGGHVGLEAAVPAGTLKQLRECNAEAMALHHITWPQVQALLTKYCTEDRKMQTCSVCGS